MQVGQAGCGRRVQRSYWTDQLPVLLRCGPRRHREGGEAVVAAHQRHTQTLPGTLLHTHWKCYSVHCCVLF